MRTPTMRMEMAMMVVLGLVMNLGGVLGLPRNYGRNPQPLCNGHTELCDRPYGNTTFLGTHDSFAYSTNPFALSRTQEVSVTQQLQLGVRMLQAQGRMTNGELHFCHTSCSLYDGGRVVDYLSDVKTFLVSHPNEVLTFIFTNPENISVTDYWDPAFVKSGMKNISYTPPTRIMQRSDWPTLGQMIDSKKRVVTFMDQHADVPGQMVDYILPQFQLMWEDPYSPENITFPCSVHRTLPPLTPEDQLSMINHNLNANLFPIGPGILISDRLNAPRTNSVNSILGHSNGCLGYTRGKAPNFVMVDYVNVGQAMDAVNRLNHVKY